MSPLLIALPAAAAAGLAAWRVALARRHAAARRAAREKSARAALKAARRSATAAEGPAAKPTAPAAARADIDAARATARARADRVIAAETARREADRRKTRQANDAAERRAAEAAAALMATLPLPHVAEVERTAPPAMNPRIPKTAGETLIMTVDDSKMVRVKSSRLLAAHGFQVVTAVDGLDALRQMEACCPDLVITDVEMPGMDGFGLVNALRGDPRTRHIPLVMITSAEERHRTDAQRAGVGLMMGKPYDEAALIAHIRGFQFFADTEQAASAAWA
jgi:chemosensory pili system protein ChpA (sensor histidine kinase/response regulator)